MTIYQTPFTTSLAAALGPRTFRKHALSYGAWTDSHGRTLTVDRPLLERVVTNFRAGALDQVPFQLAGADNAHTDDPERYRGEIKGLEIGKDGLYMTAEMTSEGAKLVQDNPNLGVSVRLMSESKRGDGVAYRDVLGHVLGTLRPQVPGLKPWETVQLANEDAGDLIDLTLSNDAPTMALTPEDLATIKGLIADALKADDADDANMSAAELQALADEARAFELANTGTAQSTSPVELSAEAEKRIADAEQRAQTAELTARAETARATWRETRVELTNAGVPPSLLDLADPVLSQPGPATPATYDMAAGDGSAPVKVTERDVIRGLLMEAKGRLAVPGVGTMSGTSEFASDQDQAEAEAMLNQLRAASPSAHRNGNGNGSDDAAAQILAVLRQAGQ